MSTLNGMKYLVFSDVVKCDCSCLPCICHFSDRIYLFPAVEQHKEFAARMPKEWKPIRGGFFWIYDGVPQCYGESISLGLQSDPKKDLALLLNEINKD